MSLKNNQLNCQRQHMYQKTRIITDTRTYEKVAIQVVESTKTFIINDLLGS